MTDVAHSSAHAAASSAPHGIASWPLLPYGLVLLAGATGLLAGRALGGDASAFEDKLLLLLRFMAGMKFLGVLAAAGAMHWRLKHSISSALALAYLAALVPMATAAGLIWSLGGIALGALLFHIGLLGFLYLAWTDDAVRFPADAEPVHVADLRVTVARPSAW